MIVGKRSALHGLSGLVEKITGYIRQYKPKKNTIKNVNGNKDDDDARHKFKKELLQKFGP
jgi:hypothetical protein